MKMTEIKFRAIVAELEKLSARLERAEKSRQKKLARAEKCGVAGMNADEHIEWLKTVPTVNGIITDKKAVKANEAWFELDMAEEDIKDIKWAIEQAEARFQMVQDTMAQQRKELEEIADLQRKEELAKRDFEEEQKEWLKDGIILEDRYWGKTPKGVHWAVYRNAGSTLKSLHCYTLRINGEVIFTSGEFWRCYQIIKNS